MSERGYGYREDYDTVEYTSLCVACGTVIDYCQGHGTIGDPEGRAILDAHDNDDHTTCHPDACDEAEELSISYCAGGCGGVATNGDYCESGCEDDSYSN